MYQNMSKCKNNSEERMEKGYLKSCNGQRNVNEDISIRTVPVQSTETVKK